MFRYLVVGAIAYGVGWLVGFWKARKIYKTRGYWQ